MSRPIDPIEPRLRADAGERLKNSLRIDAPTARLVLDAQVDVVRILRDVSGSLDAKANVIIVASGALLTAFATISPAERSHFPSRTLIAAVLFLAGAFFAGIIALFVAGASLPTPVVYNRASTLADPQNEGKICSELVEVWYRYALRERRLNSTKARRVVAGFALVSLALLVLVVGGAIAAFKSDSAGPGNAVSATSRNLNVV